jgi:hypothetical protein
MTMTARSRFGMASHSYSCTPAPRLGASVERMTSLMPPRYIGTRPALISRRQRAISASISTYGRLSQLGEQHDGDQGPGEPTSNV